MTPLLSSTAVCGMIPRGAADSQGCWQVDQVVHHCNSLSCTVTRNPTCLFVAFFLFVARQGLEGCFLAAWSSFDQSRACAPRKRMGWHGTLSVPRATCSACSSMLGCPVAPGHPCMPIGG